MKVKEIKDYKPDDIQDDCITFVEDSVTTDSEPNKNRLKILTVDDDLNFQQSISFVLSQLTILNYELEIFPALSYTEASRVLTEVTDIAIALIDVVMESDDAGLRLVRAIREVMGNEEMRLVLITGQSGTVPFADVMNNYDINDYWNKADLTVNRLQTILTTNARSFQQVKEISRAKRGLQLIAESSGIMYSCKNHKELSGRMLAEVAHLLNLPCEGLVCVVSKSTATSSVNSHIIIRASEKVCSFYEQPLSNLKEPRIYSRIMTCILKRESIYNADFTCLFFPDELASANYIFYLATGRPLSDTEIELLRVFSVNICGGLHNIALVSKLDKLAYEDHLLKIPNRNVLLRTLANIINQADKENYTLLLIDVDNFSSINMVLGPDKGDTTLKAVTALLRRQLAPSVLLARVKDDLFSVLGPTTIVNTQAIVDCFGNLPSEDSLSTINISTLNFPLQYSGESALDTLTRARLALKRSKSKGINQHNVYNPTDDQKASTHFSLHEDLQASLNGPRFTIALQPQISLETGNVTGVEALARWNDVAGKPISPGEFIPLAEASGLILRLGFRVQELACQAAQRLHMAGFQKLRIGINYSALQFQQFDLVNQLRRQITDLQLRPQQFEIEVTETVTMSNFPKVEAYCHQLRELGIHVAIDDFGTGFSSLSYLSKLPVDRIKIDRSFVGQLTRDSGAEKITETIIHLGHHFKKNIIAEGVETHEQLTWLKNNGCHAVQGYYFAQPMPLERLLDWLAEYRP